MQAIHQIKTWFWFFFFFFCFNFFFLISLGLHMQVQVQMKEKLSLASNICIGCPTTWGSHDRYFLFFRLQLSMICFGILFFFFYFLFFKLSRMIVNYVLAFCFSKLIMYDDYNIEFEKVLWKSSFLSNCFFFFLMTQIGFSFSMEVFARNRLKRTMVQNFQINGIIFSLLSKLPQT